MKPGAVVHYVSYGTPVRPDGTQTYTSECRAAVVSEVEIVDGEDWNDEVGRVGLVVLNPTGVFFRSLADGGCKFSEAREPGTWHWFGGCAG